MEISGKSHRNYLNLKRAISMKFAAFAYDDAGVVLSLSPIL